MSLSTLASSLFTSRAKTKKTDTSSCHDSDNGSQVQLTASAAFATKIGGNAYDDGREGILQTKPRVERGVNNSLSLLQEKMGANEAEQDDYHPAYFHVRQFFVILLKLQISFAFSFHGIVTLEI